MPCAAGQRALACAKQPASPIRRWVAFAPLGGRLKSSGPKAGPGAAGLFFFVRITPIGNRKATADEERADVLAINGAASKPASVSVPPEDVAGHDGVPGHAAQFRAGDLAAGVRAASALTSLMQLRGVETGKTDDLMIDA